ncbi:MAG: hypothetical protein BGO55_30655 [Sphingobacteriales bacterium 50-39]|nr:hypothetical protein [Sphingobacteriales bacterium]OJW60880.1 MAG: hypothetical protein BGO55_30655 [Sphingobacteriales bacterium 50-39]
MRVLLSCLLFALVTSTLTAQDLDFPDYRSKKDNFAKISDKDIRSDLASFVLAGVDESIGKAPLNSLPVKEVSGNSMTFDDGNIQVTIRTGVFFPSKHKMMYTDKHLLRIDNHPYYGGTYGVAPQTTIESITVVVGKDTVAIPPTAYNDLFDPQFSFNQGGANRSRNGVFPSNDKHTFYIYMLNINSGGSEFTWVIRDKQYLRRVVDFGFLTK